MSLSDITRAFGVEADRIRLLKRGGNVHWAVSSRQGRFVLRRYGDDPFLDRSLASCLWEHDLTSDLAAAGYPALAALAPPREIDGAIYALFPFRSGRAWRFKGDEADYRRLGQMLAGYHKIAAALPSRPQRVGRAVFADGAFPTTGGRKHRDELLALLTRTDPDAAKHASALADEIEPRLAASGVRDLPMLPIHGDFSSWNLALENGALTALFDFDLAHMDIRAADVCFARRGSHDDAVRGYLEQATLSRAEIEVLDALWLGSVLWGIWRVLDLYGADTRKETLRWNIEQLAKTRPYRD